MVHALRGRRTPGPGRAMRTRLVGLVDQRGRRRRRRPRSSAICPEHRRVRRPTRRLAHGGLARRSPPARLGVEGCGPVHLADRRCADVEASDGRPPARSRLDASSSPLGGPAPRVRRLRHWPAPMTLAAALPSCTSTRRGCRDDRQEASVRRSSCPPTTPRSSPRPLRRVPGRRQRSTSRRSGLRVEPRPPLRAVGVSPIGASQASAAD